LTRKFKRKQDKRFFYRVNERIFADKLRVLDSEGKQIGILSKFEALKTAKEQSLDLVEIAGNAVPPVAKIIDFKKFLYQQEKRKQEEKKKTRTSETKEVRLGPFISDNDLLVVIKKSRGFLEDGNKVKFVVKFRGRQITHPEFGFETLKKCLQQLSDISKIEREGHLEGKQLICLISPEKQAKKIEGEINAKEENKKISK